MAKMTAVAADHAYRFGNFRISLSTYELFKDNTAIAVEPQVFNLLGYLVQHRDRVVTKDELLDELWGHRYVSDSALSTQIKTLRKVVGDSGQKQAVIQTVRGRGFRFVAAIESSTGEARTATSAPAADVSRANNLPRERTQMFGRDLETDECAKLLDNNRLVSVLGIGGTGKTRLAARIGREITQQFSDGVWFIDLIPLASPAALETAVADVLGMALTADATRPQLIEALRKRDLLLIFDNCEHMREAAADLINELLEYTSELRILATSRDPLNLIDEQRFFLNPLATHVSSGVAPAVALFDATAARHGVQNNLQDQAMVQQICSQLDGLPLAIELAAAQLRHLTLKELNQRLHQRFEVLAGRERTISGRQSNLLAVLQDTWEMLTPAEQDLLAQLAVFPSRFTMTAVEEVLLEVPQLNISAAISRLVDLGLIQRTSNQGVWWRMLETVRAFATRNLSAATKHTNAHRHAKWCLDKLGRFPDDQLDNLHQAEWCMDHYSDLEVAEQFYVTQGETQNAYALCCGTGLMVQLDDGARAKERLERAEHYLAQAPSPFWCARLHAIAGLCAQANRLPQRLNEHNAAYLSLARSLHDPELLANALLMQSLTTGFLDPDLAHAQLQEMIDLGEQVNNASLVQSGTTYRAWQYVMGRDYSQGSNLARELVEQFDRAPDHIDNPAYNCIGIIVSCCAVEDPEMAAHWSDRLAEFPAVLKFWGIQNLLACVDASNGAAAASAQRCLDIKTRLNRAARDEFPDLLVTAILLAYRLGESARAQRWLTAIRNSEVPIQMYHTIAIYRQLYTRLNFAEDTDATLESVRDEVKKWLVALSQA
ncbi:MAG: winged helix-turn-helix domain-containing protein [Pseudomonadota bacterium]